MTVQTFNEHPVDAPPPEIATARRLAARLYASREASIAALLVAVVVIFTFWQDNFMTTNNIKLLLVNVSMLAVVSVGLTFVLLVGGFDLSIGAQLGFSGFVLAWWFNSVGLPIVVAIVLTVLTGAVLAGISNGLLIGRFGLSFMVVSLGTMTLFFGLIKLVSDGVTEPIPSSFFVDTLSFGSFLGVPYPIITAAVTAVVASFVLKRTLFGRDVYAVGGNANAASLSGINVTRTMIAAYMIAGAAAAVGAVIAASRTGSAGPTVGDQVMLQAAAAVLVGGTSLRGGSGTIFGTVIGVVFFGVLSNGLQLAGYGTEWQQIISGLIILGAALADRMQRDGWRSLFVSGGQR